MPDTFGFATPKEAREAVRSHFRHLNDQVVEMGDRAPAGIQAGNAINNIFGGFIKKTIDTRKQRVRFRDEVMAETGLSKREAMAKARREVRPEFAEVRRAKHLENVTDVGRGLMDELIRQGVPAQRAQAVGMMQVANALDTQGMKQEASALRIQASELMQAQDARDAETYKAKADLEGVRSTTKDRDTRLAGDNSTWLKIKDGTIVPGSVKSIAMTDTDGRDQAIADGYIDVGNSFLGVDFTSADFGGKKLVPEGAQSNLVAGLSMLHALDMMEAIKNQTGFIEGPLRGLAANFGIIANENQEFVDVMAVRKKLRADIQSLVKGIPSNYDASIFEAMIPDPSKFAGTPLYVAQIETLRRETLRAMELTAAFHKGTDKPIPEGVQVILYKAGVNIAHIPTMSAEDVERVKRDKDKDFKDQDNPFSELADEQRNQLRAFEEEQAKEKDPRTDGRREAQMMEYATSPDNVEVYPVTVEPDQEKNP